MTLLEILIHIGVFILIVASIVITITWMGEQVWIMNNLHNQCIADCVKFNAEAVRKGIEEWCVC